MGLKNSCPSNRCIVSKLLNSQLLQILVNFGDIYDYVAIEESVTAIAFRCSEELPNMYIFM